MYNGDILLYPHMSKCLQYKWQYKGLKFNGLLYPYTSYYQHYSQQINKNYTFTILLL